MSDTIRGIGKAMIFAAILALGMGEWTKGTYSMANAAVLIGVIKL